MNERPDFLKGCNSEQNGKTSPSLSCKFVFIPDPNWLHQFHLSFASGTKPDQQNVTVIP